MTTEAQPTVRYETRDRKANLILDRPERLNAIDFQMPGELAAAGMGVARPRRCGYTGWAPSGPSECC